MTEGAESPREREPVVHEKKMAAIVATSAVTAGLSVERGLNDTRLAVLAILVGIGLTVGFGAPGPWWVGILAGRRQLRGRLRSDSLEAIAKPTDELHALVDRLVRFRLPPAPES